MSSDASSRRRYLLVTPRARRYEPSCSCLGRYYYDGGGEEEEEQRNDKDTASHGYRTSCLLLVISRAGRYSDPICGRVPHTVQARRLASCSLSSRMSVEACVG